MAVEQMRGCGFRKVGGLYLVGEGQHIPCDRLPYELNICPVCGGGIKFTRGWTWIDWEKYASLHSESGIYPICICPYSCPICSPGTKVDPYGLLWVGEQYYTPELFVQEALKMGVSRRIAGIPKNLKLGETWVLLAHKSAITKELPVASDVWTPELDEQIEARPGIFYVFRPKRLELLIWESESTDEKLDELTKRGITPIIIPDGDVEHDPLTSLKPSDEQLATLASKRFYGALIDKLQSRGNVKLKEE